MTETLEKPKSSPKRKPGTGTIKERSGTIFIGYRPYLGGEQVWERVGRISEGVTRKHAEDLLDQKIGEIRANGPKPNLYFEDAARIWRQRIESNPDFADSTKDKYRVALDCHLIPAFRFDPVRTITPELIETYADLKRTLAPTEEGALPVEGEVASSRGKPLKRTAIQQQLSTLNQFFRWAVREKIAETNPLDQVEIRWGRRKTKAKKILEREEVEDLVESARPGKGQLMILLLAGLGLRIGELLALCTDDYDPRERSITINGTMARVEGKTRRKVHGKTAAAHRTLKLRDGLSELIEKQISQVEALKLGLDKTPLFPSRFENFMSRGSFDKIYFKPALEAAALGDLGITPKWLRNTFASECIAEGMPVTQLCYAMGHSDPHTTLTVYAGFFRRHQADVVDISGLYTPALSRSEAARQTTLVDVNETRNSNSTEGKKKSG